MGTKEAPCAALRDQVASVIASEVSGCMSPQRPLARIHALLLDIDQDADDHEQGGVVPCIFCPFSIHIYISFGRSWFGFCFS
jgi:hypothetical protein